jgi:membrane protease YdiL (CAAX protease family)
MYSFIKKSKRKWRRQSPWSVTRNLLVILVLSTCISAYLNLGFTQSSESMSETRLSAGTESVTHVVPLVFTPVGILGKILAFKKQ